MITLSILLKILFCINIYITIKYLFFILNNENWFNIKQEIINEDETFTTICIVNHPIFKFLVVTVFLIPYVSLLLYLITYLKTQ